MNNFARIAVGLGICAALFAAAWRFAGDLAPAGGQAAEPGVGQTEAFPRTSRDVHGDELTLEHAPAKLASQALVTDHFLFAVVPHERIVAVSTVAHDARYSYVADIVSTMDVAVTSDPEAMLRRRPELLLVAESARADYVDLARSTGVPVFRMLTLFETFHQIAEGLETTGYVTGEDAEAAGEIQTLRRRIAVAKARRPAGAEPARVLAFSSFSFTYGKGSLFDHIVGELGAVNVGAEQGLGAYGTISSEQVAAWNPDWIVADAEPGAIEATRARMLADPGVAVSEAGRQGRILIVETRTYLAMSQQAAELMESLAAALYPEAM